MVVIPTRTLDSLVQRRASAFVLTGVLIFASLIVPLSLKPLTDWSWVVGILSIGLAVLTGSVALLGVYPQVTNQTPNLAHAAAGAAVVAGVAALGLITLVGIALGSQVVGTLPMIDPMRAFGLLGLMMTGGFSLGLLLFGAAMWQTAIPSRTVSQLLLVGGIALLVPVLIEIFGPIFGVETPPWVLFPVILGVALDTVVIGFHLGAEQLPASTTPGQTNH